jgi:hypothetical protein
VLFVALFPLTCSVPTYLIDYSFWPVVQGINFHFVPVRHQLLVVNSMCYFDDICKSQKCEQRVLV